MCSDVLGKILGNFVVTAPLGEGGMGEVFLAEHRRMGRKVAIKLLRPQYSVDPAAVERLFNEARATSMISHPGIVQIFDCDLYEGRAYLVMEFLEGQSLRKYIANWTSPDVTHIVWLSSQIASALQAAHEKGIIHRDLKPDNVFLTDHQGMQPPFQVKVLDFGIAKLRDASSQGAHLTGTGMLLGTPLYMSPEQCRGNGTVDDRSDIYSLGCMMFEMFAGAPPFQSAATGELIAAHLYAPPPLLQELAPNTPAWLCELVAQMLSKSPSDRPQSMLQVQKALAASGARESFEGSVGRTLVLPPSRSAGTHPELSAPRTTLGASAKASTLATAQKRVPLWVPVAVAAVALVAFGLWTVLPSQREAVLPSAASAPTPPSAVEPVATLPTTAEPHAALPPLSPDAAVLEPPAPIDKPLRRTKRDTNKPFRGFDEL
jgi:eukaryotic-like serine/threonine-protein kinase